MKTLVICATLALVAAGASIGGALALFSDTASVPRKTFTAAASFATPTPSHTAPTPSPLPP